MNIEGLFVGAVGGKPGQAYYFVGTNHSGERENEKAYRKLIYLDPHYVQEKVLDLEKEYKSDP